MKAIVVGTVAVALVACAQTASLPELTGAKEDWTKAYTQYDIPIAIPYFYQGAMGPSGCGNGQKVRSTEHFNASCQWGITWANHVEGEIQRNALYLLARRGDAPLHNNDISAISDSFIKVVSPDKSKGLMTKRTVGDMLFHDEAKYPYYSQAFDIFYTDAETEASRHRSAVGMIAPVPATDTHNLLVAIWRFNDVEEGNTFAHNPDAVIDFEGLGIATPRDTLFSVLDQMDHVQNPELFVAREPTS